MNRANLTTVVQLNDVSFAYPQRPILQHLCWQIPVGAFVALIGPNGGGKSTLLKLLLGLLTPHQGEVYVLGQTPHLAAPKVGYVPQFASFRRDFPISVLEVVLQGCFSRQRWWGGWDQTAHERAQAALAEVGLADFTKRSVRELSGGQLQRVLIARALVSEPFLLLLDEPTANVDPCAEHEIFTLLAQLQQRLSIVVVSHDVAFVAGYASELAYLQAGKIHCHAGGHDSSWETWYQGMSRRGLIGGDF